MFIYPDAPNHAGVLGSLGSDSFVGLHSKDSVMEETWLIQDNRGLYTNKSQRSNHCYLLWSGLHRHRESVELERVGLNSLYLDLPYPEVRLV